jgi:hypothetical protein
LPVVKREVCLGPLSPISSAVAPLTSSSQPPRRPG